MVQPRSHFQVWRNPGFTPGFTLLELVIAVSIIGVLASLLLPALTPMRDRAERIVCNGNLRSLHASLSSYLTDNGHWPQVPKDLPQEQMAKFWVDSLKDYGATQKVWTCPTLQRLYDEKPSNFSENPTIHYIPAQFDDNPMTPNKWPAMPWVIEIASLHGDGNMIIRGDGGLRELNQLLREAGGSSIHQLK